MKKSLISDTAVDIKELLRLNCSETKNVNSNRDEPFDDIIVIITCQNLQS